MPRIQPDSPGGTEIDLRFGGSALDPRAGGQSGYAVTNECASGSNTLWLAQEISIFRLSSYRGMEFTTFGCLPGSHCIQSAANREALSWEMNQVADQVHPPQLTQRTSEFAA
jgi:hypothetical protein